ncbi:hypothetical protein [Nocardioides jiangxiensis]|uniref:Uncharacterized protein n=1 Tax=Nocardioides jiangxiensis TaxID=3064524 RepID=A0ABT9AX11_9ACTN|nr:hypothetical protein [Nocardioides sp. WY-20]MDO7867050.1 hypothetical protein [Nocardioides sp. WY-20]
MLLVLAVAATAACGRVPARPDEQSWRETASTAVDDAVALVGTASLVLEQQKDGHLLGGFGVSTLVHSEDSLGKAVDSVSTVQPPAGVAGLADKVDQVLSDADDAVRTARMDLVDGETASFDDDRRELADVRHRLLEAGDRL